MTRSAVSTGSPLTESTRFCFSRLPVLRFSVLNDTRSDAEVVYPLVARAAPETTRARDAGAPLRLLLRSRLQPIKNADSVLRAVKRCIDRGVSLELDVVGEGQSRARLERLSRELGIELHVRFHGFLPRPESERVSGRAHVFALLPFDEPFGMVFVEAALAGLTVLGPDAGGPPEILREGGFLAPPEEPEAIAERIIEIQRAAPAELEQRSARLRRHCLEHYTAPAFAQRVETLFAKPR